LLHADRRTDRLDEANSSFSQFCERSLNMIYGNLDKYLLFEMLCCVIKMTVFMSAIMPGW
jgi:hypothetical protein